MKISIGKQDVDGTLIEQLERITGEKLKNCYQCGNCSGGCPVSYEMEYGPSQVIRLLQLGRMEQVQAANSMWVCVGCLQCYSRCPKGVSAASILEGLRLLALRKGLDHELIEDLPMPLLKRGPQQALVCGFRKFVS